MHNFFPKLKVPLFVLLIGSYPIAFLAERNAGQFTFMHAVLLTGFLLLGMVGAFLVFRGRSGSQIAAGVAAVFSLVMFFAYPQIVSWTGSLMTALKLGDEETPYALDLSPHIHLALAIVWALTTWALGTRIARARWAGRNELTQALTFAGVALLAVSVMPILFRVAGNAFGNVETPPTISTGSTEGHRDTPDIYFVVLDGYARADVLKKYYEFDNSPFLEGLRSRGFQIADKSSSNYKWTFLSIASTLNLGYLQDLFGDRLDPLFVDRTPIYEAIRSSAVARFLRERGYRIVHFQSTWGATSSNPYADQEIKCENQVFDDEVARSLIEASWLSAFSTKATVDLAECHLANLRALTRIGNSPGPKFVFAHFVLPHHPYLFDRSGNVLRNATVKNQFEFQRQLWENKAGYLEQLEFLNRMVLKAVDGIVADSAKPPLILLVSDHGPNLSKNLSKKQYVGIGLANLGAYLLPGAPKDLMPMDGSAVNQFRRIFSFYFGADLPPLPDRYYISPFRSEYDFREVPGWVLQAEWKIDAPKAAQVVATSVPRSHPHDQNGDQNVQR